jgi:acyl carrier protein
MTKSEISQQVIRELSFIYDEEISEETTFADLDMDSLDMIEFMSDCEDRFCVNFDSCEQKPKTIAELVSEIWEQKQ